MPNREMLTRSATKNSMRLPLFLISLSLAASSLFAANKDRHVILITLDGFPAYLWRDESVPLPHLRKLAADGAVANAMTISNPAITWPNHTTLVTGVTPRKHGVLYNGLVVRGGPGKPNKIEPWVDKDKLVLAPTIYDAAFKAGLTTAEVDWAAITRPGTITWSFAELVDPEAPLPREMVAAGVATAAEIQAITTNKPNVVWRDEMWTRAACFAFAKHQPNLLLFHPLNTDAIHHRYGPGSPASLSALALADHLVGELLRTIDASGKRAQTTLIITTDHGFKKVEKYVYPNVALKKAGLLRAAGPTVTECAAFVGSQGGIGLVYITDPARRAELLPKLKEIFAQVEGIAEVIDAATGAPALGMPTPTENQGMGELILYPKAGYAFSGGANGDALVGPSTNYGGTHGYSSNDPELDGIFVASGAGIKKGVKLERMRNIDVAPTIARLLDVPLPNVDGRVLEQILERSK
jgi:predicted AlkP superfamily pyrophosphatase or phosphodiesterase